MDPLHSFGGLYRISFSIFLDHTTRSLTILFKNQNEVPILLSSQLVLDDFSKAHRLGGYGISVYEAYRDYVSNLFIGAYPLTLERALRYVPTGSFSILHLVDSNRGIDIPFSKSLLSRTNIIKVPSYGDLKKDIPIFDKSKEKYIEFIVLDILVARD